MTVIHEIQQVLWVETPHGENTIYIVALKETRKIKHYTSEQIKICVNNTLEIE